MSAITNSVKQEFYEIKSNMRFEQLKNIRTGKIWTITAVAILMSSLFVLIPILSNSDFPDNSLTFISNVMSFVSFTFVLFALFLGADAINREHYAKTDLLIYPLPQRKSNVIIAKYITQLLTSWVGLALYYAVLTLSVIWKYGSSEVPNELITSFLFALLYMSTVLAFAFFLSSTIKSTASSMTLTFFGIQILLPLLGMLLSLASIDTSWIFSNYSGLTNQVIGLSGESFGPDGATVNFDDGVIMLTIQTILFLLATLYFGTKKEVGE